MQMILGDSFERYAVDFAGRIERHLLEENNLLGCLVADALAAEQNKVSAGRRHCALAQRYVCAHVLSVHGVVNTDDSGQPDVAMLKQRILDLEGADVGPRRER